MSKYLIVGAGALGCLYAAELARAQQQVYLLVRDTQANIQTRELAYTRIDGTQEVIQVQALDAPAWRQQVPTWAATFRGIILATKAQDALASVQALAPQLPPQVPVLLLQNGMGSQQAVAQYLGAQHLVLAASVTEGAYLKAPCSPVHAGRGVLRLGAFDPRHAKAQDAAQAWVRTWPTAHLKCIYAQDIHPWLWQKLAINAVINPLTLIYNCPNGELMQHLPQVRLLVAELQTLLQSLAIQLPCTDLQTCVQEVIQATAGNISSMLQDQRAGRPTELAYISAYVLACAKQVGLTLPAHAHLYQQAQACLAAKA